MPRMLAVLLFVIAGGVCCADDVERQTAGRVHSKLFRHQYTIADDEFCGSEVCVDFDGDGQRELLYASRSPGRLELLNAADGSVRWRRDWPGQQQSMSARDLDGDGDFEILYTVSGPGTLYVCDHAGKLLGQWDSGDDKLGNSPVIIDADGDGTLDGFLGTRSREFVRLHMDDLTAIERRRDWVQCGCYTSAMDVDHDGLWDLFAGSGDDYSAKGALHRLDPLSLATRWSYATDDNASSADAVLVDIDGDGAVEIIKSVDNYKQDDAHDAVYAFETDGTLVWQVPGFSGEDSPNVADLDADGVVEIVGMTFGGEVYCLDPLGHIRWRRDLRPELDDGQHMYMAPILCDLNGDAELEILAMTHGQYSPTPGEKPNARLTALNADGDVLDELDLGEPRYWGHAYVCNVDDDPQQELVVSGYGGLDVFETLGYGPDSEHFQRRRSYQRLNVRPWMYADSYFIERGLKDGVVTRTDNLALARSDNGYASTGCFTTDLFTLPPNSEFRTLNYRADVPPGTRLQVNVRTADGSRLREDVEPGTDLRIAEPVWLEFGFSTSDAAVTPLLDSYALAFDRATNAENENTTSESTSREEDAPAAPVEDGDVPVVAARREPRPPGSEKDATSSSVAGFGQSLTVTGPEQGASDAAASVALAIPADEHKSIHLVETTDGSATPVASQVEPGDAPRLWWIVRGELAAGAQRTYRIERGEPRVDSAVTVDRQPDAVTVRIGDASVLQYNIAHVDPPAGIDARYGRSGHIHPAWTPSGTVVTDQFPEDHAHQSGLWLAFVKTEFERRTPDFWNLLGGTGRVVSKGVTRITGGAVFGEFEALHEHVDQSVSPEKIALNETWNVRVWNVGGSDAGYRVCDVVSRVSCATDSPLRLPEYHYGGMALRGSGEWYADQATFVTSEGKDRIAGNHTRPWWCDLSGTAGEGRAGILFITHPDNFRAPEPLRIHPKMPYMVYTPSFLGDWEITPDAPHVSRYRFVFHDGDLPVETANRLQRQFAQPLEAHVE